MSRSETPVSVRFLSDAQLTDVEDFATRHAMSRNAAIMALISFGLRRERELMAEFARQYEQTRPRGRR